MTDHADGIWDCLCTLERRNCRQQLQGRPETRCLDNIRYLCNEIELSSVVSCFCRVPGTRGVSGIYSEGASHFSWFFPRHEMLHPVKNFHFGRPKTIFYGFEKWKEKKKKKKKKKKVLYSFVTFPLSIFNFPPSLLHFFLLLFSIFPFFLASFFPVVQQKFPDQKSRGALCPLAPPPPPPVTPLHQALVQRSKCGGSIADFILTGIRLVRQELYHKVSYLYSFKANWLHTVR